MQETNLNKEQQPAITAEMTMQMEHETTQQIVDAAVHEIPQKKDQHFATMEKTTIKTEKQTTE